MFVLERLNYKGVRLILAVSVVGIVADEKGIQSFDCGHKPSSYLNQQSVFVYVYACLATLSYSEPFD